MDNNEPQSPTKHERDIRLNDMKLMRQQLLDIRERRKNIPKVPQPQIVTAFAMLHKFKNNEVKKKTLEKRLKDKKKDVIKMKGELLKYQQIYNEKQKSFQEKEQLLNVLEAKLSQEYDKTKNEFRDLGFDRSITAGVRKLSLYRLGEVIFNKNSKNIFNGDQIMKGQMIKGDQEVGIFLGYLGLLITLIGKLCQARIWMDFTFKGSKSTIILKDGTSIILRPNEIRWQEGKSILTDQLQQLMTQNMGIKLPSGNNLYTMCEELSLALLQ